jgi:hypothetical protein
VRTAGKRAFGGRRARPGAGRRSPIAALFAVFALIVQLVAAPAHQARPDEGARALALSATAAELKARFGDAATLCVRSDDHGAPAGSHDCDDQCPLCRFSAEAASLVAPDLPVLPALLDASCRTLGPPAETCAVPLRLSPQNRARAPPVPV